MFSSSAINVLIKIDIINTLVNIVDVQCTRFLHLEMWIVLFLQNIFVNIKRENSVDIKQIIHRYVYDICLWTNYHSTFCRFTCRYVWKEILTLMGTSWRWIAYVDMDDAEAIRWLLVNFHHVADRRLPADIQSRAVLYFARYMNYPQSVYKHWFFQTYTL